MARRTSNHTPTIDLNIPCESDDDDDQDNNQPLSTTTETETQLTHHHPSNVNVVVVDDHNHKNKQGNNKKRKKLMMTDLNLVTDETSSDEEDLLVEHNAQQPNKHPCPAESSQLKRARTCSNTSSAPTAPSTSPSSTPTHSPFTTNNDHSSAGGFARSSETQAKTDDSSDEEMVEQSQVVQVHSASKPSAAPSGSVNVSIKDIPVATIQLEIDERSHDETIEYQGRVGVEDDGKELDRMTWLAEMSAFDKNCFQANQEFTRKHNLAYAFREPHYVLRNFESFMKFSVPGLLHSDELKPQKPSTTILTCRQNFEAGMICQHIVQGKTPEVYRHCPYYYARSFCSHEDSRIGLRCEDELLDKIDYPQRYPGLYFVATEDIKQGELVCLGYGRYHTIDYSFIPKYLPWMDEEIFTMSEAEATYNHIAMGTIRLYEDIAIDQTATDMSQIPFCFLSPIGFIPFGCQPNLKMRRFTFMVQGQYENESPVLKKLYLPGYLAARDIKKGERLWRSRQFVLGHSVDMDAFRCPPCKCGPHCEIPEYRAWDKKKDMAYDENFVVFEQDWKDATKIFCTKYAKIVHEMCERLESTPEVAATFFPQNAAPVTTKSQKAPRTQAKAKNQAPRTRAKPRTQAKPKAKNQAPRTQAKSKAKSQAPRTRSSKVK